MNIRLTARLGLALALLAAPLAAQVPAPGPDSLPTFTGRLRSAAELDELLAPLALYPDALVAIVLPAATRPVDLGEAEAGGEADIHGDLRVGQRCP